YGFLAVLRRGTAVLVDDEGVPRVKCYCGNPLLPPVIPQEFYETYTPTTVTTTTSTTSTTTTPTTAPPTTATTTPPSDEAVPSGSTIPPIDPGDFYDQLCEFLHIGCPEEPPTT